MLSSGRCGRGHSVPPAKADGSSGSTRDGGLPRREHSRRSATLHVDVRTNPATAARREAGPLPSDAPISARIRLGVQRSCCSLGQTEMLLDRASARLRTLNGTRGSAEAGCRIQRVGIARPPRPGGGSSAAVPAQQDAPAVPGADPGASQRLGNIRAAHQRPGPLTARPEASSGASAHPSPASPGSAPGQMADAYLRPGLRTARAGPAPRTDPRQFVTVARYRSGSSSRWSSPATSTTRTV